MNVTKKEIDKLNKIQLEIFKEFVKVCEKLNLNYFLVHGSLLGAVRYNGFFPYDDDIDVAMPRRDYEIFIKEGQNLLKEELFIQSNETEKNYPLVFAKLKNSNTTFIQPILNGLDVNKGIYIDIFPIDNFPKNKLLLCWYTLLEKIYRYRILPMFNLKKSFSAKFFACIAKIIVPNQYTALKKLNHLYADLPKTGEVILYGGKKADRGIDLKLFEKNVKINFEGLQVSAPADYKSYLNIIYGDYRNYSPSEKYMRDNDLVEISANILDTEKSYKEYEQQ